MEEGKIGRIGKRCEAYEAYGERERGGKGKSEI